MRNGIETILKAMELARRGATTEDLAAALGVSPGWAAKMVRRYKIPVKRQRVALDVDEVIKRFMNGETIEELEADLGVNREDINRKVKQAKGVELYRIRREASKKRREFNPHDGRSYVCQQIDICREEKCYRKNSCPAYGAWQQQQLKRGA